MAAKRIAFVHTVGFLVDLFRNLSQEALPGVEVFHILNESLLKDLLRDGATPAITDRVVRQALLATDAGPDLVVFTCSSTSPMIDVARRMSSVPILKVDEPMAEAAVRAGRRIGLVCTARSTIEPSSALLHASAATAGKTTEIVTGFVEGAYEALFAGDRARHDSMVTTAAVSLAKSCDALVLAQVSLAHLRDPIASQAGIAVFASPAMLMERLQKELAAT